MRLVFVTQQVDEAHPILAATVPKVRALAERVDELAVLALGPQRAELPANVRVRSFGAPTKPGRTLRYERLLLDELRRKPVAVVAHMAPVYAVLAAPLARPRGVRVLLWFTHWRAGPTLRLAERLSNAVVSVDRRTFPIDSPKVRPIGHGIEVAQFPCRPPGADRVLRALALGRYSAAKGLPVVLRAVRLALDGGLAVSLRVHGAEGAEHETAHRRELEALVRELGLGDSVTLGDAVPRDTLPELFAGSDVLVNNMRAGATDKVVYEAAAGCLPVLASNAAFDELFTGFELSFARESPEELALRLRELARLGAEERAALGRTLRERVVARHSVGSWADGILEAARG